MPRSPGWIFWSGSLSSLPYKHPTPSRAGPTQRLAQGFLPDPSVSLTAGPGDRSGLPRSHSSLEAETGCSGSVRFVFYCTNVEFLESPFLQGFGYLLGKFSTIELYSPLPPHLPILRQSLDSPFPGSPAVHSFLVLECLGDLTLGQNSLPLRHSSCQRQAVNTS